MVNRRPVNRVTPKRLLVDAEAASQQPIDVDESTQTLVSLAKDTGQKSRCRFSVPRLDFGRTGSWRRVLAAAAGVLVLGGSAAFAATHPGVNDANAALVDTVATEEVKAAAVHALLTIYGYDVKTIDRYDAAVRQVVTGQMLTDLDKFSATTVEAIKQAQTSVQAAADPVGVSMLTADHAELLVNLTVAATKDGIAQQSVTGTVVLRMKRLNGTWLAGEILDQ